MEIHLLRRRALFGALVFWMIASASAQAARPAPDALKFRECLAGEGLPDGVLLIDLTNELTATGRHARFLDRKDARDAELIAELESVFRGCPRVDLGVARNFLDDAALVNAPKSRFIADRGMIAVIAFHVGRPVELQVTETVRATQLRTDFGDLLKLLKSLPAGGAASGKVTIARADYRLKTRRATITFNAIPYQETLDPEGGPAQLEAQSPVKVAEVLSGSTEHFRLSANLPINSVKHLQYDTTAQTPTLKETPREFLAGIDWYFGDVLRDDYEFQDPRRFGLKGLVRFSKEPLDTVGVVAAYRHRGLSIIAGPIWTRQSVKVGTTDDGTDVLEEKYKQAWRVGMGFDLAAAIGWFSSAADGNE
jgi:hypothetical protein